VTDGLPCELCGDRDPKLPHFPEVGIVRCGRCGLVFYPPPGRLLEIGCAYGFFLDLAREHWSVRGFDITHEGVEQARQVLGLDVVLGEFLEAPDEPDSTDIVCLWDTVEHLAHPVRVLEKAARWLKAGGVLVFTTGDLGSLVARIRGRRWRLIHPPTHLYYFTRETAAMACRQAGLVVERTTHVGYRRSFRSMVHGILGGRRSGAWVQRLVTVGDRLDFAVHLDLHDIMMVVARRPGPALS
jgi:SAM-dependent methyltransferase